MYKKNFAITTLLKFSFSFSDISPIMPWYLKVDWVFFNVSNTISILISIMYWGLIYTG